MLETELKHKVSNHVKQFLKIENFGKIGIFKIQCDIL